MDKMKRIYFGTSLCREFSKIGLEVLYALKHGAVYSDYAVIPFEMTEVRVCSGEEDRSISDYEELKKWWSNEK